MHPRNDEHANFNNNDKIGLIVTDNNHNNNVNDCKLQDRVIQ